MDRKKITGKGAPSGAPVGLPFNPFVGLEQDPAAWLLALPERMKLFLEMRPSLPRRLAKMAKDAAGWAKYCSAAIEAGDTRSASQAAARAALATHVVWMLVEQEGLVAKANRDSARQKGPQKDKGLRRPFLAAKLDSLLNADPEMSDKALWRSIPEDGAKLYREGEEVFENGRGGLKFAGFQKQVTAARKRRR